MSQLLEGRLQAKFLLCLLKSYFFAEWCPHVSHILDKSSCAESIPVESIIQTAFSLCIFRCHFLSNFFPHLSQLAEGSPVIFSKIWSSIPSVILFGIISLFETRPLLDSRFSSKCFIGETSIFVFKLSDKISL